MMKNIYYRILGSLLAMVLVVSCNEKITYFPNYQLENIWAVIDSDGTTSSLYEFKDGMLYYYSSKNNERFVVANNTIWECNTYDFIWLGNAPYSVTNNSVYYGTGEYFGELYESLATYEIEGKYYASCMDFNDGSILVLIDNFSEVNFGETANPIPDPTPEPDPEPEFKESGWGIVGTMTNWGENGELDIPMYVYEDFYFAFDVYLSTSDELKFRKNNDWSTCLTFLNDYPVEFNSGYYLADGFYRNNIKVSQSGYYDIYMLNDLSAVFFMQQGYMPNIQKESSYTVSFADKSYRTSLSTEEQIWMMNGVRVTNAKASSLSDVADYSNPARFYKGSSLKIEKTNMTRIEFHCNNYKDTYPETLQNSISGSKVESIDVNSKIVTVTFTEPVNSFLISTLAGQVRLDSLIVYAY